MAFYSQVPVGYAGGGLVERTFQVADPTQVRFKALKSGDICELHGVISDSTDFPGLLEFIAQVNVFDFQNTISTSFNGLRNLLPLLQMCASTPVLTGVPQHVLKKLFYVIEQGSSPLLGRVQIRIAKEESNSKTTFSERTVDFKDVISRYLKNGAFYIDENQERICGSLEHISRHFLSPEEKSSVLFGSSDQQEDQAHALFWYDYICFVDTIIFFCLDEMKSLELTLSQLLNSASVIFDSALAAVSVLRPGRSLVDVIPAVAQVDFNQVKENLGLGMRSILFQLDTSKRVYELLLDELESNLAKKVPVAKWQGGFLKIATSAEQLLDLARSIELVGTNLFGQVGALSVSGPLVSLFDGIADAEMTPESVEKVRDAFSIMDIMSEGDWPATKEEIRTELLKIDDYIMKLVLAMQSYDVTRQVLEHRINEANLLKALGADKDIDSLFNDLVKDQVATLASSKLVTDQEKNGFGFYFPAYMQATESLATGDIHFF